MKIKRDKYGDAITPEVPEDIQKYLNKRNFTYSWKVKINDTYYEVDHNLQKFNDKISIIPEYKLEEIELFPKSKNLPWDKWVDKKNKYEYLLDKHFKEAFTLYPGLSFEDLKFEYSTIILPTEIKVEIKKLIRDYQLQEHEDFLFYLIIKIQNIYIKDIEFYETPEERHRITNISKEIDKLVRILKEKENGFFASNERFQELKEIRFKFDGDLDKIAITDSILLNVITDSIIAGLSNNRLKNWEKKLNSLRNLSKQNVSILYFRERISKSFHQFFVEQQVFNFNKKQYVNSEFYCIAEIFKIAGVPIYKEKEYNFIIDREKIKSLIQMWCIRNDIEKLPKKYSIKPERLKKLYQYFDEKFINCVNSIISLNEFKEAVIICKVYDLENHAPEISHLMRCLAQRRFQIGHQRKEIENIDNNPELQGFSKLLRSSNYYNHIIESISIKIKDSGEQYNLHSDLILHLILESIRQFQIKHPEEFNWDLFKTNIEDNIIDESYNLDFTDELKKPNKRFLPLFCKSLYNYLLNEAPPGDKELYPSVRYHKIIASILEASFVFKNKDYPEWINVEKVKNWLQLVEQ